MKKNVLIHGLILGTLLCLNGVWFMYLFYNDPDFKANDFLGYTILIVIFSLVFFGIKNYRDKHFTGNEFTFGKGFKTGLLVAFVGSTLYVVAWLFCQYLFVPDFIDKYVQYVINTTQQSGVTAAELAQKTKDMEEFREMYRNPLFAAVITYMEVFPLGLIVALISALILKRKQAPAAV
jgi:hypothetical protein